MFPFSISRQIVMSKFDVVTVAKVCPGLLYVPVVPLSTKAPFTLLVLGMWACRS